MDSRSSGRNDPAPRGWAECLASVLLCTGVTVVVALIMMHWSVAIVISAIVLGGISGGFTLSLIGGERYGVKLPGPVGVDHRVDPGYLGDMFVGLMAAFLGTGLASRTLKTELFAVSPASTEAAAIAIAHAELWFVNFAISYVCGFVGLRLIKGLSERLLQELQIKEGLARVDHAEGTTEFLSGQDAIRSKQYQLAEASFRRALALDKGNEARALVGLGRVYSRLGRYREAIEFLNQALGYRGGHTAQEKFAVVF